MLISSSLKRIICFNYYSNFYCVKTICLHDENLLE